MACDTCATMMHPAAAGEVGQGQVVMVMNEESEDGGVTIWRMQSTTLLLASDSLLFARPRKVPSLVSVATAKKANAPLPSMTHVRVA